MKLFLTRLLHALLFLTTSAAAAAGTGGVTGQIPLPAGTGERIAVEKYTGSISGRVGAAPRPQAAVWLEGPGLKAPSTPPRVVMTQEHYQFSRSMLVVPKGTTVEFPNADPDYHNIFSLSRPQRFDLGRYKKNETPAPVVTFDTVGLIRLQCEIHAHMRAVVRVVDSPHSTTSDEAGNFTLNGLPPGTWTLCAQVDEKRQWKLPVTIAAGRLIPITFPKP